MADRLSEVSASGIQLIIPLYDIFLVGKSFAYSCHKYFLKDPCFRYIIYILQFKGYNLEKNGIFDASL